MNNRSSVHCICILFYHYHFLWLGKKEIPICYSSAAVPGESIEYFSRTSQALGAKDNLDNSAPSPILTGKISVTTSLQERSLRRTLHPELYRHYLCISSFDRRELNFIAHETWQAPVKSEWAETGLQRQPPKHSITFSQACSRKAAHLLLKTSSDGNSLPHKIIN